MLAISMIDRLNFSSKSLNLLLQNIQDNHSHEYSCGIIVRAQMLDCLIILNAIIKINSTGNLQLLKEFCIRCLCDTVSFAMKHLEKDNSDKLSLYKNLVSRHPFCFEEYIINDDIRPILKCKEKIPSAKDLYKNVSNSNYSEVGSWAFESYEYYSKYDHFGNLFYSMSLSPIERRFLKLEESIKLFVSSMYYSIILLSVENINDNFLYNQRKKTDAYIKQLGT